MSIRVCGKADVDKVISTMCRAFMNEELYCFFIPDEGKRQKFLGKFMKFRLTYGLKKGKVFVTDECSAAAIWIKPGQAMSPVDLLLCGGMSAMMGCGKEERQRIMWFNGFSDEQVARVMTKPFWHLSPICVAPQEQGRGCGTALLHHGLQFIRESGAPCYLETQSEKNRTFYQNSGFELKVSETLDHTQIPYYGMVYQP